jgi:hypothetical protein
MRTGTHRREGTALLEWSNYFGYNIRIVFLTEIFQIQPASQQPAEIQVAAETGGFRAITQSSRVIAREPMGARR